MTHDEPEAAVSDVEGSSSPNAAPRAPIAGVPSDNVTMQELLDRLNDAGYGGQFDPVDGDQLRCSSCENDVDADDLDVVLARRLEGASDPDDMATVFAARCPVCQNGGTVVLGYGVNASDSGADLSRKLHGLDSIGDQPTTPDRDATSA